MSLITDFIINWYKCKRNNEFYIQNTMNVIIIENKTNLIIKEKKNGTQISL